MDEAAVDGARGVPVGRSGGANERAANDELGFRGVAECACAARQPFFRTDGEQHLGGGVLAARVALDARRIRVGALLPFAQRSGPTSRDPPRWALRQACRHRSACCGSAATRARCSGSRALALLDRVERVAVGLAHRSRAPAARARSVALDRFGRRTRLWRTRRGPKESSVSSRAFASTLGRCAGHRRTASRDRRAGCRSAAAGSRSAVPRAGVAVGIARRPGRAGQRHVDPRRAERVALAVGAAGEARPHPWVRRVLGIRAERPPGPIRARCTARPRGPASAAPEPDSRLERRRTSRRAPHRRAPAASVAIADGLQELGRGPSTAAGS